MISVILDHFVSGNNVSGNNLTAMGISFTGSLATIINNVTSFFAMLSLLLT
jgi:hypothetical protein